MAFLDSMTIGARFTVDTKGAVTNLKSMWKIMGRVNRRIGQLGGRSLPGLALALGSVSVASFGVAGGIAEASSQAANFEDSMAGVRAVVGDNAEAMEKLNAKAKELGISTKFTAAEAADGLQILQRAGFDAEEALVGIEGVLNAAAAEGLTLAKATDVIAGSVRGFGLEASQTTAVADLYAKASANAKVDIKSLGESMKFVAAQSNQLGIDIVSSTAAVSALGDAHLRAGIGGRNLATGLIKLANPSDKAKVAMQKLGFQVVKNVDGGVNLLDTLKNLGEALEGTEDRLDRTAFLADIFDVAASKAFGILASRAVEKGDRSLQSLADSLQDSAGAAKAMADIRLDTLTGQTLIFKAAVEGLNIEALGPFNDLLKQATTETGLFVQQLVKGFQGGSANSIQIMGQGMAFALDQIRLLIVAANELALNFKDSGIREFFQDNAFLLGIMTIGMIALALAMGPVAVAFAAIALTGFFLGELLLPVLLLMSTVLIQLGLLAIGLWGAFKGGLFDVIGSLTKLFLPVLFVLESAWKDFKVIALSVFDTLKSGFNEGADTGAVFLELAIRLFAIFALLGAVSLKFGLMFFRFIIVPLGKFLVTMAVGLLNLASGIGQVANSIVGFIQTALSGLLNLVESVFIAIAAVAQAPGAKAALGFLGFDADAVSRGALAAQTAIRATRDGLQPETPRRIRELQEQISNALNLDSRMKAAATAPDVQADVLIDDKRTLDIKSVLCIDGAEMAVASGRQKSELSERAGFTATPWQRRQILERGAAVASGTGG